MKIDRAQLESHGEEPDRRLREDADALERFYREARAMATLHHPNLCPFYDIGRFEKWDCLTMASELFQAQEEKLANQST